MPDVKLVNAYGLTETSDDTEPRGDERGARRATTCHWAGRSRTSGSTSSTSGSASCRLERRARSPSPECAWAAATSTTRSAPRRPYSTDPYVDGARLYRAGDYGRWSPDGKLEYLGRRDNQVKISGFRIEIGDIENALLRVPGVRDGAVVVGEGAGQSKFLVAFYSGNRPLEVDEIRERDGYPGSRLHGPVGVPVAGEPAPDRQREDRPEGLEPHGAGGRSRGRHRHGGPLGHRAAACRGMGDGPRPAAGPDRQAGLVLRSWAAPRCPR